MLLGRNILVISPLESAPLIDVQAPGALHSGGAAIVAAKAPVGASANAATTETTVLNFVSAERRKASAGVRHADHVDGPRAPPLPEQRSGSSSHGLVGSVRWPGRVRALAWCMSSRGESGKVERGHRYELFEEGRSIGWLEWRPRPRERLGWYLLRPGGSPVRLDVDLAIDDLARARRGRERGWELTAELAALLSTALALDAADRALHPPPTPRRRPLLARSDSARYQIYTSGLAPDVLARAVPELPLAAMDEVVVLEGQLTQDGLEAAIRRIKLLGGRVHAVRAAGSQA